MMTPNVSARLSILALAVMTAACAPARVAAQDSTAEPGIVAPNPPVAPVAPAPPVPTKAAVATQAAAARLEKAKAEARRAEAGVHFDPKRLGNPTRVADGGSVWVSSVERPAIETPALLVTQQMDPAATTELKEDLSVMNKLLRDEINEAGEDGTRAMGIKLMVLNRNATAPMYIEGAGAIFSASVGWPLAPSGEGDAKRGDRPGRERVSTWERAKREIKGGSGGGSGGGGFPMDGGFRVKLGDFKPGWGSDAEPLTFEQSRVDDLIAALVKVLPEASNFRHLKENESVFITIVGSDDAGAPRRLTLKAAKADIDLAAAGKMDAETFRQRVKFQIGQ